MASKLPYFRMFPKDFTTDECVMLMSLEETGLYIKCLNHAWTNGSIPADLSLLAKLFSLKGTTVKKCWARIACKFVPGPVDGTMVNPRLEKERAHIVAKSEEASKNAKRRANSGGNYPEIEKCNAPTFADLPVVATSGFSGRSARASESESESESEIKSETRAGEDSELDLEDAGPVFVENSARRCGLRKRVKEPTREIERLSHRWEQAERDYGPTDLRRGWLVFLDFLPTDSDIEHPQAYFLGSLARWISEAPQSPPTRIKPHPQSEPAIEAEPLFEDLYREHPKKSFRVLAQQALVVVLTSAVNPQETAARIRKSHAEWVPTWGRDDGKYAPRLDRWLTDSGWMDDAPPVNGRPHIDYSDPKRYELGD